MKKNLFFALALMLVMGIGGLVYDASAAQNSNSSKTSMGNMGSNKNMGGRRHRRRHGRRHGRRHRRGNTGNKNKNANR